MRHPDFIQGILLGVLAVCVIVAFLMFFNRGRFACVGWGERGQVVHCRVHR